MRVAFIDLMEAEGASEAHRAQAREGVNPVDTGATIETGAEKQRKQCQLSNLVPLTCYLKVRILESNMLQRQTLLNVLNS